jgi:hypothetical protein
MDPDNKQSAAGGTGHEIGGRDAAFLAHVLSSRTNIRAALAAFYAKYNPEKIGVIG